MCRLVPVGDPLDGKIYIRGGYHSATLNMMDIYNPRTDKLSSIPIPQPPATGGDLSTGKTGIPSAQWYGAAWYADRASILYFGGRVQNLDLYAPDAIYEYTPKSNTWGILQTTGRGPTPREDPCVVIDQYSSKLVVYGGQYSNDYLSDVYILDLISLVWMNGPSMSDSRIGMACALFDDGFLVWGGSNDPFLKPVSSSRPSVLNITTLEWTTSYKTTNTPTPIQPARDTGGKSNKTLALSLGLTMGALGLGAICIGIFLYRREKKKATRDYDRTRKQKAKNSQDPASGLPELSSLDDSTPDTCAHEMTIPQSAYRRNNEGEIIRHQSRERLDQQGGASVRSFVSGKYSNNDETGDKEEDDGQTASSMGHKIELEPSSHSDKYEDSTFVPPSSMRPTAAPPVRSIASLTQSFAQDREEERGIYPYYHRS
ncbi:hypothetical protein BGX27_010062 [Mortierella sp. AM989]|nr:hypothetical protein BGX27_010062 [Mortierella sp. AM989]